MENNIKTEVIDFLKTLLPNCIIASEFHKENVYSLGNDVLICVHLNKLALSSGAMNDFLSFGNDINKCNAIYGKLADITLGISIYSKGIATQNVGGDYNCEAAFDAIAEGLLFNETICPNEIEREGLNFIPEFQVYCLEAHATFSRMLTKAVTEVYPKTFNLEVKSI